MSNYIFSKFNYYQKSCFSDNFLIYNSLKRKIVRLSNEDAEKIGLTDKTNCKYISANEKLESMLVKYGIIIPEYYNENSEAHLKYLEEVSEPVLELTIVPTYRCNFRCPYCYQDHEKGLGIV